MNDLSEILRDAAAPAGPPPSVESLRRRTQRRRRSRRIALAAGAAAILAGGAVVAVLAVPDDEGTVTTDTGPAPTTTLATSTTLAPSTTAVQATTTIPTTTTPTSTAPVDDAVTPATPVRVEIRVVGPYGVPFPKGVTFANACPDDGGACLIGGVPVDNVGGIALEVDPSMTYDVTAAAAHSIWANPESEFFSFSPTIVATGADLDGTVFVVDRRPGREQQPSPPDPASFDPSDVDVQRSCATVDQAVTRLANLTGEDAPVLAAAVNDLAADLDAAEASAPLGLRTDLQSLTSTVADLASAVGELGLTRAEAGEDAVTIDNLVTAIPSYLRTVASREGLAGPQPSLAVACDPRSNGVTGRDDMIVFSDALNAFLTSDLAAEARFATLTALADVTDHARRGHAPMSTFVRAFEDCSSDPAAVQPGDNVTCDRLYDACRAGDLLACNDLYYSAAFQSRYEVVAFFCGDRLTVEDESIAVGGYCELIDG